MTDRTCPFTVSNNLTSITKTLPGTLEHHVMNYEIILPLCDDIPRRLGERVAFVGDVIIPIS